ncbi:MtrAB system histidine kinase MtrB [Phycicoccus sp. DTK01]|uniref:MtrAB system histidine kinase MtrB n=1 Tax=Phycicoccus sp. DTK01 TaxID=2785745 RepID=UPI001AA6AC86|nr:MtrAB system histidine kinase MtrB [Phycicoccus sp. DTK01]GIL35564.1 two-component sensor histidine kinase [Phycicoccus sp. DTK01]
MPGAADVGVGRDASAREPLRGVVVGPSAAPALPRERPALVLLRRLSSGAGRRLRGLRRRWRQSLRLRVVATTMLLGLAVVSVLGSVLHEQIATGLERSRITNSQYEALSLTSRAQVQWNASTSASVDELNRSATDIMTRILSAPGPDPSRYVVMNRSTNNDSDVVLVEARSNRAVGIDAVSQQLRAAVAADPGRQHTQVSTLRLGGRDVPAVVVGSVVTIQNAGLYDLYFIFPMEQEVATMDLIGNAFLVAGVILTLLVGAVAWVVTRQVVTPVRRAGQVAQRLSAGRLNERMPARGEDDLALLATSFNNMADSLQSQIRQLEGLSAVQQRFVSDVSHELRTPLTTIRMAVDVLHGSRDEFEAPVARSAELLAGELDRFEALLADLLEISRFDAGGAVLDLEPVDLRGTVAKVVEAARPLAERRGSVVTVVAPDGPAEAEVDERRVERILRNLVVNAVEHGEGRPVEVRIGVDDHAVAVVVEDHGVGLRPGDAANVFTRFWRADPARARTTGGTGLGLSISLEDARLHNGWLQAWGEPGEGSRFRLTLPAQAGTSLHSSPLPLSPRDEQP